MAKSLVMRSVRSCLFLLLLALPAPGCRALTPADIPMDEPDLVVVKSHRIPHWWPLPAQTAIHTFLDYRTGETGRWRRIEISNGDSGVVDMDLAPGEAREEIRWERLVQVLRIWRGEEARRIALGLRQAAARYPLGGLYAPWPGPNSNTFQSWLTGEVDGYRFDFDHNAVGKDFPPSFRVGPTPSRTGLRVDTHVLGFALALEEGVEVHFLGLTFGVSVLRPALKIPGLPRLGVPIR